MHVVVGCFFTSILWLFVNLIKVFSFHMFELIFLKEEEALILLFLGAEPELPGSHKQVETWYLILDTWYLVLGTWYLVLGGSFSTDYGLGTSW